MDYLHIPPYSSTNEAENRCSDVVTEKSVIRTQFYCSDESEDIIVTSTVRNEDIDKLTYNTTNLLLDQDFETESEVRHVENQDNDEMKQCRNSEKDSVRKPTKSDAILSKVNSKIIQYNPDILS